MCPSLLIGVRMTGHLYLKNEKRDGYGKDTIAKRFYSLWLRSENSPLHYYSAVRSEVHVPLPAEKDIPYLFSCSWPCLYPCALCGFV